MPLSFTILVSTNLPASAGSYSVPSNIAETWFPEKIKSLHVVIFLAYLGAVMMARWFFLLLNFLLLAAPLSAVGQVFVEAELSPNSLLVQEEMRVPSPVKTPAFEPSSNKSVEQKSAWARSYGLIGLFILVSLWLFVHRFSDKTGKRRKLAKLMLEFREASARGDLETACTALFAWSRGAYGETLTLVALSARLGDPKATEALLLLDAISCGETNEKWHIQRGEAIAAALRHGGKNKIVASVSPLPKL
jgi:hypothetical protein